MNTDTAGFVVIQLLSHLRLFATPWTAARQVSLSFTIAWSLLKFMSTSDMIRLVPRCKTHSWHLKACLVPRFWPLPSPRVAPSNTSGQF